MDFKVYIYGNNGFPESDEGLAAYLGFSARGATIIFFEDIEEVPVSKYNMVVTGIEDTSKYLRKLGVTVPDQLNIPAELESFAGRRIEYMTMDRFRAGDRYPLFVKPHKIPKLFVPQVVLKQSNKEMFLRDVSADTDVMVSEVVDFISEYRCYVIDGQLQAIRHYLGDIRIFPDVAVIDQAIKAYKTAPAAYAMDFGITDGHYTLLVECNDGWCLGNYGIDYTLYTSLLCKRWLEMVVPDRLKP